MCLLLFRRNRNFIVWTVAAVTSPQLNRLNDERKWLITNFMSIVVYLLYTQVLNITFYWIDNYTKHNSYFTHGWSYDPSYVYISNSTTDVFQSIAQYRGNYRLTRRYTTNFPIFSSWHRNFVKRSGKIGVFPLKKWHTICFEWQLYQKCNKFTQKRHQNRYKPIIVSPSWMQFFWNLIFHTRIHVSNGTICWWCASAININPIINIVQCHSNERFVVILLFGSQSGAKEPNFNLF